MKSILLILFISALLHSCSKQSSDLSFLNGEWISDSLKIKNDDHWREFLYFKNGKLLAHTTLWGSNYILNKNRNIHQNRFMDAQGTTYSIHPIDSLTLEIKGKEYYGRFTKEKFQPENINSKINEFEQAQENRKVFLGNWKIIKLEKKLIADADPKDNMTQEIMKSPEFKKLLSIPIGSIDQIKLDNKYFTVILKSGNKHEYSYILTPDSFDVYSGDAIYKLKYKIESPHQFRITTYNTIGIYIDIIFAKQYNS